MKNTMYIGPGIRGVVRKNQVFTDKPTEIIDKAMGICELSKYLFIGMDDIVAAKKELKRDNSFLDIAYKETYKEVEKWLISITS
ncbi:MAG: hypothetical protein J5966_07645 [Lachnospiraceae bacterium]|nr:hypothetical protein [Lachnospiraceae bacterium]